MHQKGRLIIIKKFFKKIIPLLLICSVTASGLTACGEKENEEFKIRDTKYEITDNSEVAFDFGKSTITYGELLYFIAYYEASGEYQKAYYQYSMGYTGDFWNEVDEEGHSEAQNYKNYAFQEASYIEVMKNEAIDAGITLSDEEIADIEKGTKEALNVYSEEQLKKSGITYEGFLSAQKTMAYAEKYIATLKDEIKESDKYKQAMEMITLEDNQAYEVNYAFISLAKVTEDGKTVDSDTELMKSYREIMKDISEKVGSGNDFTAVKEQYADNQDVIFGFKVVNRNSDEMDTVILEKLGKLKKDEVSDVIETDYGIFVFEMLNPESDEAYKSKLEENSEAVIESIVTDKYNELFEKYEFRGNEELLAKIEMGKVTLPDNE